MPLPAEDEPAADAAGLEVAGFATQAAVLLGGGIEARLAAAMEHADEARRARLAHGVRQLLLPGEMGESVKLVLLTREGCTAGRCGNHRCLRPLGHEGFLYGYIA